VPSAARTRGRRIRPTAAQGHLAGLGAVPHGGAVGVVAALGADQPGDVVVEHGLEYLQARADRQGEQALVGGAGKLGDREGWGPCRNYAALGWVVWLVMV
jgi:hypothetical protein